MTKTTLTGKPMHPAVEMYAQECKAGDLSRREFLARASALGATTAAAYAMIGVAMPTKAEAMAKQGPFTNVSLGQLPEIDPVGRRIQRILSKNTLGEEICIHKYQRR